MGKPFSHSQFVENPYAAGSSDPNGPMTGGYLGLENWANSITRGSAGDLANSVLKQLGSGDYTGLASTMLSPIHDRFATNLREADRAIKMQPFFKASQPALAAGIESEMRRRMAQDEGLAYGQAIPSLWGEASNIFQNAKNSRQQAELNALQSATSARLGSGSFQTQPGWFDRVGQVVGTAAQLASLAGGISGLAGFGGAAGAAGAAAPAAGGYFANSSSPYYVPGGIPDYGGGAGAYQASGIYGAPPPYIPPPIDSLGGGGIPNFGGQGGTPVGNFGNRWGDTGF